MEYFKTEAVKILRMGLCNAPFDFVHFFVPPLHVCVLLTATLMGRCVCVYVDRTSLSCLSLCLDKQLEVEGGRER